MVFARLRRNKRNAHATTLAEVQTNGQVEFSPSSSYVDTSVVVDNSNYSYYLELEFPDSMITYYEVTIEYSYDSFLSSIFK